MPLAPGTHSRRRKKTPHDLGREIPGEHFPEAAKSLWDLPEDGSPRRTARAGVAKDILERAVGKGQLSVPDTEDKPESTFELILRVVE